MARSDKSKVDNTSHFQPKGDFEDYLTNDFNLGIYRSLTKDQQWKELFSPQEFFNLFYEQVHFIEQNKRKPVSVQEHLLRLRLPEKHKYYVVKNLKDYYQGSEDLQIKVCCSLINDIIIDLEDDLEDELFTEMETEPELKGLFDFTKDLEAANQIEDLQDRLLFLKKRLKEFNQQYIGEKAFNDFDSQVNAEIDYVQDLIKSQQQDNGKPTFQLSNSKRGSKIDIIRILNALYELRLLTKPDGQIPSKGEFMQAFGDFIGEDLKGYHSNLSQALQNQPLEVNLRVFHEMIEITQNAHHTKK